jgi:D-alanyl-D-alanine carboxypeptidase
MQKHVFLAGAVVAALILIAPPATAGPGTETPSATDARLEQIAATVETLGVPGYIQGVHGQCADSDIVRGFTELQGTTPLPFDARSHIGSITKTFTATVILQLADEGVIGLDEPITEWQPSIPTRI